MILVLFGRPQRTQKFQTHALRDALNFEPFCG